MTITAATTTSARPTLGLPDPGERVPALAWPTVALYVATLGLFAAEVWAYAAGAPLLVTVPIGAAVTFLMFSVLHEATHHAVSTRSGLNNFFGRISAPFVAPYGAFSMLKFIHIEHHRNTNEPKNTDPDAWTSEGPWWQLPFRWATIDVWYVVFYGRRITSRPPAEQKVAAATLLAYGAVVVAVVATGNFTTFAALFLIPQRLGLAVLAWWFDYLPHHGLTITQRENKYRATRVRVGGERLLTPLFVYQNYHLVHHLHPSIPFYRYVRAWQRNEAAYLDRDAAISTWFGKSLTPAEYRTWRRITDPVASARAGRLAFHPLKVAEVRALSDDSVAIEFEVPADLVEAYAFTAGQHVTLRGVIDGHDVRRTYSICSEPGSGRLRVGIRRQQHGAFSTYATRRLSAGDVLDVMTPSGSFGDTAAFGTSPVIAVAAGSGITPILPVLQAALAAGRSARLIYGNKTPDSTMFADELAQIAIRHPATFHIDYVYSRDDAAPQRIDAALLEDLVPRELTSGGEWFLCGPAPLIVDVSQWLEAAGNEDVRAESFGAVDHESSNLVASSGPGVGLERQAEVSLTLDGTTSTLCFVNTGPTVLEAALDAGVEVPYSCAGGACGTCRAVVLSGSVTMDQNHVLSAQDVADGVVLTCQSRPSSDTVQISFDAE